MLIKAFVKIKKLCFYLLNLCVNHSVLSFFSFLCDNLLLKKCVQSLCEITVFLCVNLIDPKQMCSGALKRMASSLRVMSLVDSLMGYLELVLAAKAEARSATGSLLLVQSLGHLQSLLFLVRGAERQVIVDGLSAPDGNFSNPQVDCLLNW